MHTEDPVIVLEADFEQTKGGYRSFNNRLHDLEQKYKHCIDTISKQNDTISKQNDTISKQNDTISNLRNDLETNLLYPLIIRGLIKQSR